MTMKDRSLIETAVVWLAKARITTISIDQSRIESWRSPCLHSRPAAMKAATVRAMLARKVLTIRPRRRLIGDVSIRAESVVPPTAYSHGDRGPEILGQHPGHGRRDGENRDDADDHEVGGAFSQEQKEGRHQFPSRPRAACRNSA